MSIIGYGEDALTIWAISKKLDIMLGALDDCSKVENCTVIYRPSFGRSGGDASSQFGEFDFIILAENSIYLGESKWDKSSEIKNDAIILRPEQITRHTVFKCYIEEWLNGKHTANWSNFSVATLLKLKGNNITKPVAPEGSLLHKNLITILGLIKNRYQPDVTVKNILIYFYNGESSNTVPDKCTPDFELINMDYSSEVIDNFIKLLP